MKTSYAIVLLAFAITGSLAATLQRTTNQETELEASDGSARAKRSGDIFSLIKNKFASSLSQGSYGKYSGYGYGTGQYNSYNDDHKTSFFGLKKSVINTLIQAVKAITGGVTAIKGQLIKGGGYLTAAAGKALVAKGDAVTTFGRHIYASAAKNIHSPHPSQVEEHYHHYSVPSSHPTSAEFVAPPSSHQYSSPSGADYGPPSSSGYVSSQYSGYAPEKIQADYDSSLNHKVKLPADTHAGLLILKKIPPSHRIPSQMSFNHGYSDSLHEGARPLPDFRPLEPREKARWSFLINSLLQQNDQKRDAGKSFPTLISPTVFQPTRLPADEATITNEKPFSTTSLATTFGQRIKPNHYEPTAPTSNLHDYKESPAIPLNKLPLDQYNNGASLNKLPAYPPISPDNTYVSTQTVATKDPSELYKEMAYKASQLLEAAKQNNAMRDSGVDVVKSIEYELPSFPLKKND